MIFADFSPDEALGTRLAHRIRAGDVILAKGHVISREDIALLQAAGIKRIRAVKPEEGDIGEDEAATAIAALLRGAGVTAEPAHTGRCNLLAARDGILGIDTAAINALNGIDESITLATLPAFTPVYAGDLVATLKIIPFAVPGHVLTRCRNTLPGPVLSVLPAIKKHAGLIMTRLPHLSEKVLNKSRAVMAARLAALGGRLAETEICAHDEDAVAALIGKQRDLGCDPILILGASAVCDRHDVIPSAMERAGGTIIRYGMPADPGNLLVLAEHENRAIIGVPGCARSPKLNGFDWILRRVVAGHIPDKEEIAAMGVGGLLKEAASRPLRRQGETSPVSPSRVAAIILAAGRSSRMGNADKTLLPLDGRPMIAHAMETARQAGLGKIIIVANAANREAIARIAAEEITDRPAIVLCNDKAQSGLSRSLQLGIAEAAGEKEIQAALVMLADMPRLSPATIIRLIAACHPEEGVSICVPAYNGERGNPVLIGRRHFSEINGLTGDVGARHLIGIHEDETAVIAVDDQGILLDIDDRAAYDAARQETG